ncbi:MAG: nucleoside triphosphate pyrophosphohydrolase, partial [Chloroflexota bacterium]
RATNARFYRRFAYIEQQAAAQNRSLDDLSFEEMDALWEAAKDNGL